MEKYKYTKKSQIHKNEYTYLCINNQVSLFTEATLGKINLQWCFPTDLLSFANKHVIYNF